MECGPGKDWKATMRQQFSAGFTKDDVLQGYIGFWNARLPATAEPYNKESILKDPGKEGTWAFPMIAGAMVVLGFLFAIRRRKQSHTDDIPQDKPPSDISDQEDALIDDLLDESGGPLS